jgi:hypothetical protein
LELVRWCFIVMPFSPPLPSRRIHLAPYSDHAFVVNVMQKPLRNIKLLGCTRWQVEEVRVHKSR